MATFGFPGGRGPNRPTQFALRGRAFADGVAVAITGHFILATTQLVLIDGEPEVPRVNHNLALYFNRAAPATTPQPWWLQKPQRVDQSNAEDTPRSDHARLHRYRAGYQTVGQSYRLWPKPAVADQMIEADAQRTNQTLLHRYRTGYQTVGQPAWALRWQAPRVEEPEAFEVKSARPTLHLYRQAFQTVGQPTIYWPRAQQRIDDEVYVVRPPADLYAYRQFTTAVASPGQPWWLWPSAVADQTTEPNPVAIDHAAALYPFRPHDAIQPIQPPDDTRPVFLGRGRPHNYVAFINGKRIVGDLGYIQQVIQEFAQQQAVKAVQQAKKPKTRIIIQGRKLDEAQQETRQKPRQDASEAPEALLVQAQLRSYYDTAYARYLLELEQDDEDALIMLL